MKDVISERDRVKEEQGKVGKKKKCVGRKKLHTSYLDFRYCIRIRFTSERKVHKISHLKE